MTEHDQNAIQGLRADLAKYNTSQEKRLDTVAEQVVSHNRLSEGQLEEIKRDIRSVREWINGDDDRDGARTRLRLIEQQLREQIAQSDDQKKAFRTAVMAFITAIISILVNLFVWLVKGKP